MIKDISIIATDESWGYVATKKSIIFEIAENLMIFLTAYSFMALINHQLIADTTVIFRGLLLFIPIVIANFIRRKYKKPYVHIIFSIIILGCLVLLPVYLEEKIGYFFFIFISSCISIYKRTLKVVRYDNISALLSYAGALVVLYLISAWLKDHFMMNFIMIVAIIISIIFIVYLYFQKTLKLLTWEALYQDKFKERIKKLKITTSAVIISAVVLLMLFSYFSGVFVFMDKIQVGFINWLSKINGASSIQNTNQSADTSSNETNKTLSETFTSEPSKVAEGIVKILESVIFILLAIVVILAIWQLAKRILEFYRSLFNKEVKKLEERESVFSIDEIKEKVFSRKIFSRFNNRGSNKEKIRRLYNKKISSFIAKGVEVNKSSTPREIEKNITNQFDISINDATSLYEKARYSKETPTTDEVEMMKKLK
ncbi:hypothetical protein [Clostridium cellulovorans]|uniref:DUF4129 domain-containing protein n=1 Tax=Clostridium cellulovorans (strain ATCC 35296 / DSM 3052 / OCM 3 / 743B) TaxID=573061 RepID=D9SQ39_CLOC7|nr:hypothetical protein [Clostridium cellulovorans]ADL52175.1 hypothetical protein Clocel_2462 [Clostridium cellulovorans 743B]